MIRFNLIGSWSSGGGRLAEHRRETNVLDAPSQHEFNTSHTAQQSELPYRLNEGGGYR
jgi:hypothetical protein